MECLQFQFCLRVLNTCKQLSNKRIAWLYYKRFAVNKSYVAHNMKRDIHIIQGMWFVFVLARRYICCPDGMPCEVLRRPEALDCRALIPHATSTKIVLSMRRAFFVACSGKSFLVRMECPAWCSGGRRPLIAGRLSPQRLGMNLFARAEWPADRSKQGITKGRKKNKNRHDYKSAVSSRMRSPPSLGFEPRTFGIREPAEFLFRRGRAGPSQVINVSPVLGAYIRTRPMIVPSVVVAAPFAITCVWLNAHRQATLSAPSSSSF